MAFFQWLLVKSDIGAGAGREERQRERSADFAERPSAFQGVAASGSEHDQGWRWPAIGVAGLA